MTETRIRSDQQEVALDFERRFVDIGGRLLPRGLERLAAAGDRSDTVGASAAGRRCARGA